MPYQLQDALTNVSRALPNGAAAVTSSAIDLRQATTLGHFGGAELLVNAPAMGVTPMSNGKTMIYDIIQSDNSDLSSPSTLYAAIITQTGAGGAGCSAAEFRVGLPSTVKRYIGLKATGSASGDATGSTATMKLCM